MVELANAAVAAILTRAPSSGGKSRLFAALRRAPDQALLEALLLDTADAVRVPGVTRVVAVEPPSGCDEVRSLLPGVHVLAQPGGTLGERMAGVMDLLLARGARAVAIVGSDLPDLEPRLLTDAFTMLDGDPGAVVLGPASDGGYYLVAATAVPPVFDGIAWGTARVLDQTRARAARHGVRIHLLDPAGDVDTPADLRRVAALRTRSWVRLHGADLQ